MNPRNHTNPQIINRPSLKSRSEVSKSVDAGARVALALFTCLFFVWFMFAADFAGAAPYKGKTKGGSSVTFALSGNKVTGIRTVVPTLCLETTGNYGSRAGGELFQPSAAARIGRTTKSKALQPAAMNMGIKATKNYEVTLKKRGRTVFGSLKLNYSFLIPDLYGARIFICSGSTTFNAKPR